MARYSDTVNDQYERPIAGADIYVYDQNEALATLTEDGGGALLNPVSTDEYGAFHFNTDDGVYQLDYHFGGRRLWRDVSVMVGDEAPIPDSVLTPLASPTGSSYVGHIAIGTGADARTVQSKLREIYSPEDFGAVGDGDITNSAVGTNDSTAFAECIAAAAGRRIRCAPGKAYKLTSQLLITGSLDLDLNGSTLYPVGNTACITSVVPTPTVANISVSSGYTRGSRSVVVASAAGLVVGQIVAFRTVDPTHDGYLGEDAVTIFGHYPRGWNEISGISGTTITFKYPMAVTFLGTVTMEAFNQAAFKDEIRVYNGRINGNASTFTSATGNGMRLCGFKRIFLDVDFVDFNRNTYELYPLQIYRNLDVEAKLRTRGTVTIRANLDVQECRHVLIPFVSTEGSGFGLSVTHCDSFEWGQIFLKGMSAAEVALEASLGRALTHGNQAAHTNGDILGNSTRGLKLTGVGYFTGALLMGEGHETILRLSSCFSGEVGEILAFNCGRDNSSVVVNLGNDSLAGTNMRGISIGSIVCVETTGSAFGIQSVPTDPQVSVGRLVAKRTTKHAIFALRPFTLGSAQIEDWALSVSVPAIQAREGGYFGRMVFEAADASKTPFDGTLSAGKFYSFGSVRTNTTAGIFNLANRYNLDGRGSDTIASGSTSKVVTHNMMFSPGADDITITPTNNPTNDPGNLYVSAAGASNFTVSCRADPGASGATFAWHVDNPALLAT